MKRIALGLALTLALSATAFAGEIPSTGITAPPPPPSPLVTLILTMLSAVVG